MHEIKLVFESQTGEASKATKMLHLFDLFNYPIEMIVPSNCIGLKIYEGDAINDNLLHDLYFLVDDDGIDVVTNIVDKNNNIVGKVEI